MRFGSGRARVGSGSLARTFLCGEDAALDDEEEELQMSLVAANEVRSDARAWTPDELGVLVPRQSPRSPLNVPAQALGGAPAAAPSSASSAASSSSAAPHTPAAAPAAPEPVPPTDEECDELLKRVGVPARRPTTTASSATWALRCALRGLSEKDCAILSHCAQQRLAPAMPELRLADFSYNSIADTGVRALSSLLGAAPALEKLSLYENKVEDTSPIAAALEATGAPQLRVLNLAFNRIGDASPLAAALGRGAAPQLRDLRLEANLLGDASAIALAAALGAHGGCGVPRLETLVLGTERAGNRIGDAGLLALVDALCQGVASLRELGLSNNPISDASVNALANALALGGAANLRRLSLAACHLQPPALGALQAVRTSRGPSLRIHATQQQRPPPQQQQSLGSPPPPPPSSSPPPHPPHSARAGYGAGADPAAGIGIDVENVPLSFRSVSSHGGGGGDNGAGVGGLGSSPAVRPLVAPGPSLGPALLTA